MSLLPVAEAQARLFALARPLPAETVAVGAAVGRWLADDVAALRDQPWTDLSAMDGYAVRAAEHPGPWRIVGESAAGSATLSPLAPGDACRIFTGAPVPPGADSILIQENAAVDGDRLTASADPLPAARHVRRHASDFARGAPLLRRGSRLGPAQIALAVLGGRGELPVGRRPRVALLSTGNELVPPGAPIWPVLELLLPRRSARRPPARRPPGGGLPCGGAAAGGGAERGGAPPPERGGMPYAAPVHAEPPPPGAPLAPPPAPPPPAAPARYHVELGSSSGS